MATPQCFGSVGCWAGCMGRRPLRATIATTSAGIWRCADCSQHSQVAHLAVCPAADCPCIGSPCARNLAVSCAASSGRCPGGCVPGWYMGHAIGRSGPQGTSRQCSGSASSLGCVSAGSVGGMASGRWMGWRSRTRVCSSWRAWACTGARVPTGEMWGIAGRRQPSRMDGICWTGSI